MAGPAGADNGPLQNGDLTGAARLSIAAYDESGEAEEQLRGEEGESGLNGLGAPEGMRDVGVRPVLSRV